MSSIGEFQESVNGLLGKDFNFQVDRAHAGKEEHVDLVTRLPEIKGADKVEVDFNGNVKGGSTHVGNIKMDW